MADMIKRIAAYYSDKLGYLKIGFEIAPYHDCMLKGDEEDCRLVSISNEGCTLAENELPHIFDSFWRGANAEGVGGSGLGLYICRQLMHKMDGEIFAEKSGEAMTVTTVFRKA